MQITLAFELLYVALYDSEGSISEGYSFYHISCSCMRLGVAYLSLLPKNFKTASHKLCAALSPAIHSPC